MGGSWIWARRALAAAVVLLTLADCGGSAPRAEREREAARIVRAQTAHRLARFGSEAELRRYLASLAQAGRLRAMADEGGAVETASAAPAQAEASGGESITNNQVAGVDEGGIVKVHGDHLVVLRRGRLFSVRLGDEALTPVSQVDAYPRGAPGGWYDEMLVHDDTIVVIGFNYQVGGTELGLFDIDDAGTLRRRDTYYLRSNDYYSSRNYASRLLGDRLVFYMPYGLVQTRWNGSEPEVGYTLPAVRSRGDDDWSEVIGVSEIYRPIQPTSNPALHTVVSCDLSSARLECTAQGILGPWGRSFYVSRDAVYVWVGGERWGQEPSAEEPDGAVYRLPFDGSAPGAVRVTGMPIDQFSFDERDGELDVVVRADGGGGDWMWAPEVSGGDLALARLPLALFTDGVTTAARETYRPLPRVEGYALQNRFVGEHLLYGTGGGWGDAAGAGHGQVIVHHVARGATSVLALPHGVDRLEVMGSDAVVVGSGGGSLHFSAIELEGTPSVAGHYAQAGASQGETRSHGFFYRAEDARGGMLGLPIRGGDGAGWHHLVEGSAGVLFLSVRDRGFAPVGVLASSGAPVEDHCEASCVDWYGNARPIFYRGRVFALLGYELVEGQALGGQMTELRRTSMFRGRSGEPPR